MGRLVDKVTPFILRDNKLLLFEHPFAGNQFPAGTVEPGEEPEAAAFREAGEETGLRDFKMIARLGHQIKLAPEGTRVIAEPTTAYARPDLTSWDWVRIGSSVTVRTNRHENGYTQITFTEPDHFPDAQYTTFEITAWVPDNVLAEGWRRYFYVFEYADDTPERWTVNIDNATFTLFWSPLDNLPPIVPGQEQWVEVLRTYLENNGKN